MRLWSDVRLTSSNCSQNADLFSFKRYILWNKVSSPFLTKYNYNLIIKTAIFIFMGFAELFISLFFFKKRWKDSFNFIFFLTYFIFSLYMTILFCKLCWRNFTQCKTDAISVCIKHEMLYFDIFSRKQWKLFFKWFYRIFLYA